MNLDYQNFLESKKVSAKLGGLEKVPTLWDLAEVETEKIQAS